MNTVALRKRFFLLALILFIFTASSCESNINFERTKIVAGEPSSPTEYVTQYFIRFNTKTSTSIIITLANGEEYTASGLSLSQASALHAILSESGIQFNIEDEEFIINKFAYE